MKKSGLKPIAITKFGGIAPILEGNLKPGMAVTAENCDLSSGKARPIHDHALVEAVTAPYNSLIRFDNGWHYGNDKFYLNWDLGGLDVLLYLESGVPKKLVGGIIANLGHAVPSPPTLQSLTTLITLTDTAVYKWKLSAHNSDQYCVLQAGTDPGLSLPDQISINGTAAERGVLADGMIHLQWDYGDNDSLGFSTIYVHITGKITTKTVIEHIMTPGEVSGDVYYIVCTDRTVGGMVDKSGPSALSTKLTVSNAVVRITAPTFVPAYVTDWYIYRLSSNSPEYRLLIKLPVATTTYDDSTADADLGAALDTEYTGASSGETITYAPPATTFDGFANDIYAGMIFAWKGSILSWCEPGKPDVWPDKYFINMVFPIKNVVVGISGAMILCEDGPYPIQGTDSELMYASTRAGIEACISKAACSSSKGVIFPTSDGLILATIAGTASITDQWFGHKWWKDNISGITLIEESDKHLIVVHSTGILYLDASSASDPKWTTLSGNIYASYRNPEDGKLYILDDEGVKLFMGSEDYLNLTWGSGRLYGGMPIEKVFETITMRGAGSIALAVSVDGVSVATKTIVLDADMDRDKTLKFPEQTSGRYCEVEWTGTGVVDDLIISTLEA